MSVSKRLSRANRIQTNEKNIVVGKLTSVELVKSDFADEDTGEISSTDQIEWIWEVPTAIGDKTTNIHEWTGLNVNSEKTWYPDNSDEPSYNKLTTILIKSELLNPKSIDDTDLETIDIESLIGKDFQFELERRSKKRTIKNIKLSTLKLID